jgi:hypothetical protein
MTDDRVRLCLVGDDPALDLLAELSRYLPVSELARVDAVPDRSFDSDDVLVLGAMHPRQGETLLREAMSRGTARHVVVLTPSRFAEDEGARAILAAAELVRALLPMLKSGTD